MKLEFDPTNPDHVDVVRRFINIGEKESAISEIYRLSRSVLKHGNDTKEELEQVMEQIKVIAASAEFED